MPVEKVKIAVVRRTYGGLEGKRVKAGTRFAVGEANGDLQVISLARYRQLENARIASPWTGEEDAKVAPARPIHARETVKAATGPAPTTATAIRAAARAKARRQVDDPPPPAKIGGPSARDGSQTGTGESPSSSPAGQASTSSTSSLPARAKGQRGQRSTARQKSTSSP